MELIALWKMLRRRWWLILLPVGVAFLLLLPALPETLNPPVRYSTAIRFTAAAPSDVDLEDGTTYEDSVYVPWLASEYVVVNLPQWVTSDSFAREVSAALAARNLTIPYEDVRSAFVADAARSILVVYMNWDDETELCAIAESAIEVLQTRNQTYFPQFAAYPATVVPLDDVRINPVAPPLTGRLSPFIRLAVALAAGLGLAVAVEYLDQTVRSGEDIRDIPVLASIPE